MALVPTINICLANGCQVLTFKDTTGAYSVSNTTGYGAPNPEIADFDTATLTIIDPDEIEYVIDLLAEGFPTDDVEAEYEIPLASLSRTSIEDGYWQFVYTIVTTGDVTYTATFAGIFTCNAKCCVQRMLLRIDENKFDKKDKQNDKYIAEYLQAKAIVETLTYYANCGNLDKFDNIKLILDKICANIDCTTCN